MKTQRNRTSASDAHPVRPGLLFDPRCPCVQAVEYMRQGQTPQQACEQAIRNIAKYYPVGPALYESPCRPLHSPDECGLDGPGGEGGPYLRG
jgi:hypothetical protein